jgi:hypothetical protein
VSEHDHEHEDIARRLRAEGQASAPPDLLPSVMAEVRAQSRRRRRRLWLPSFPQWRPVVAWAGAAAALVALGVGISHLNLKTSSSSSGSVGSVTHGVAAEGVPAPVGAALGPETFTVSRKAAAHILGTYFSAGTKERVTSSAASPTPLKIIVPAQQFGPLSARLRAAERQFAGTAAGSASTAPSGTVVIKLMRAHAP